MVFCPQRSSSESLSRDEWDAKNGHLIYRSGDVLEDRCGFQNLLEKEQKNSIQFIFDLDYFSTDEIINTLGEGTFGKVVQCLDHGR